MPAPGPTKMSALERAEMPGDHRGEGSASQDKKGTCRPRDGAGLASSTTHQYTGTGPGPPLSLSSIHDVLQGPVPKILIKAQKVGIKKYTHHFVIFILF